MNPLWNNNGGIPVQHVLAHAITDLRSAKAVIKALGLKPEPYVSLAVRRVVFDKLQANALRVTDRWQKNRSYTYGPLGLFIDGIHILVGVRM